ncbi:MAG TPA: hypothetical protein DDY98_05040, partial [Ruminococcaceae bacterium]|nr:hypothetical protein [Oscillospiraceae bacterium]
KEDIQMFIAGDETISLDLSGVTIKQDGEKKSVSDLKVGDVITLTYNSKGALKKAEIIQVFSGFNGNFKGMPVEKPTE